VSTWHNLNAAADVDSSGAAALRVFLSTLSAHFFLWSVFGEDEQRSCGDTHSTAASKAARPDDEDDIALKGTRKKGGIRTGETSELPLS
jgi:hypothetical protein